MALGAMLSAAAFAGDEDRAPAYKIYVDPETGQYTTEDPFAEPDSGTVASAMPQRADDAAAPAATGRVIAMAAIIGISAAGFIFYRRRYAS